MRRIISHAALTALLVACDSPATVVASRNSPPPSIPIAPTSGAIVRVLADTAELFVGELRRFTIEASDRSGAPVSTDRAVVTSSNPSVAAVSDATLVPVSDSRTGLTWQDLSQAIRLVGPGAATIRATLPDGGSDSMVVLVHPQPVNGTLLAVDSFTVVEYRASCSWACPYLVYAPLLKLRESTGKNTVAVISVEFTLGDKTTGICRGTAVYTPGLSAQLNGIDDYLWSNDLIFVSLDGTPLAGDVATAHVIVRDAAGAYTQIVTSGPVQRMVSNPVLPAPQGSGWQCN